MACAVAAQVWHSSYISSQHLQENLVCITFAQPHLEVPQLEDIARDCPSIRSTIHCIYYDEDLIPRLARILDHSCSQSLAKLESAEDQPEVKMKIPLKEPPNNVSYCIFSLYFPIPPSALVSLIMKCTIPRVCIILYECIC